MEIPGDIEPWLPWLSIEVSRSLFQGEKERRKKLLTSVFTTFQKSTGFLRLQSQVFCSIGKAIKPSGYFFSKKLNNEKKIDKMVLWSVERDDDIFKRDNERILVALKIVWNSVDNEIDQLFTKDILITIVRLWNKQSRHRINCRMRLRLCIEIQSLVNCLIRVSYTKD